MVKALKARVTALDTRTAKAPPKVALPFYSSPEWRGLIDAIVRERGMRCEDPACKAPGRVPSRIFGDHIVELRDGGAPLDPKNILLRCGSCHTRKTARARTQRAGGV